MVSTIVAIVLKGGQCGGSFFVILLTCHFDEHFVIKTLHLYCENNTRECFVLPFLSVVHFHVSCAEVLFCVPCN